jgi:hypothetical protein
MELLLIKTSAYQNFSTGHIKMIHFLFPGLKNIFSTNNINFYKNIEREGLINHNQRYK